MLLILVEPEGHISIRYINFTTVARQLSLLNVTLNNFEAKTKDDLEIIEVTSSRRKHGKLVPQFCFEDIQGGNSYWSFY